VVAWLDVPTWLDDIGKRLKEEKGRQKKKETPRFQFSLKFVDCHITDQFTRTVPHQPWPCRFVG
jgi:hypothetical protein